MSAGLAPPSLELARRILATVPYDQRLRVGRLTPPVGILAGHVRSLHELHLHLEPDLRSLPGVSLGGVATWLAAAIGDGELASRTRQIDGATSTYVEKCERLLELVAARIAQAREALREEPAPAADSTPRAGDLAGEDGSA